jgi:hypothetical protein
MNWWPSDWKFEDLNEIHAYYPHIFNYLQTQPFTFVCITVIYYIILLARTKIIATIYYPHIFNYLKTQPFTFVCITVIIIVSY